MSKRVAAFLVALLVSAGVRSMEVAGVRVEERARVGDAELVLNGAGLRSKLFFKIYVGALYVPERTAVAETLVAGSGPRRMVLRMLREMPADTLFGALREGLQHNTPEAEMAALGPSLERMAAIFKAVGTAREGDSIVLDFAGDGVAVGVNGEAKGRVGDGAFARALLRIWLGEHPVDAALKKALLGQ